ncbi:MAG: transglutaminase N-terminal domain-containing protein [Planctomycetaceae bacterium]
MNRITEDERRHGIPSPEKAWVDQGCIRYDVRHVTTYSYSEPVPVSHNEVHLVPRVLPWQQVLSTQLVVEPNPSAISQHIDYFGNPVGFFSIEEGHDRLVIAALSTVEILAREPTTSPDADEPWERVRDRLLADPGPEALEAGQFRLDSPYVRGGERLAAWTQECFEPRRPWREAVFALTRRIHREFTYDPSATTTGTPVEDVFDLRRGVCQDFAHLQIACIRSIGLAARYVSGYLASGPRTDGQSLVGADASHAWLSVWGGPAGWLDVDPTNDCLPGHDHVTVSWGRDYGDVCPIKGVYVGGGHHGIEVSVDVRRLPDSESL